MSFNGNPFVPVSVDEPPQVFPRQAHPLKPPTTNNGRPVHTNKFYTNLLLDDQTLQTWVQPYSLWWTKNPGFVGMSVSHTTRDQFVYGPDPNTPNAQYYFSPIGIQSMVMSAVEFDMGPTDLALNDTNDLSCKVSIIPRYIPDRHLDLHLVIGMGFVTGIYWGLLPKVTTQVGIQSAVQLQSPNPAAWKYEVILNNGVRWLMYVSGLPGDPVPTFSLNEQRELVASFAVNGCCVQLAAAPVGTDPFYDEASGRYVTDASVTGEIIDNGARGNYRIQYDAQGYSLSGNTLVFAAPHHVASLTSQMESKRTSIQLDSTNMGVLTAYLSPMIEMTEPLPIIIEFDPYASFKNANINIGPNERNIISSVAAQELQGDVWNESNLNSMYFSGKKLDKYAQIAYVCKFVLQDDYATGIGLDKVKQAFARFATNTQQFPLVYDTEWKGLISVAGLSGDPLQDFGNSYYNDHNFHYGYFIHAAAVIGQIDKVRGGNWAQENKAFVNSLVRDVANPSTDDPYFPRWRSFDWYAGHSWAKGIFTSGDGKDQESSSEDFHFAYGMKLWGNVLNDPVMEARGNLMLAVLKRALNTYIYYKSDNTTMPSKIIPNKVSGILFENKVDYATWFSDRTECKHGIHMIPVTSVSSFIRQADYVQEEWNEKLAGIVDTIDDGWRGILYQNKALFDPWSSFAFFAQGNFDNRWLDDGMSRTWSLAFAAVMMS